MDPKTKIEPLPIGSYKTGMETLGKRLAKLRNEKDLSQRELAKLSGVSAGAIGKLERDARPNPEQATIVDLARGLGISPDALMSGVAPVPGSRGDRRARRRAAGPMSALDEALEKAIGQVVNEAELRALAKFPAGQRLSVAEWAKMIRTSSTRRLRKA